MERLQNRLAPRFSTPIPLQKLVTDIIQISRRREIVLEPIIDLYNGEVIAFGIKKRPTLDLVMRPLDETNRNHKESRNIPYYDSFGSRVALPAQPMGENIKDK